MLAEAMSALPNPPTPTLVDSSVLVQLLTVMIVLYYN